MPQYKNSTFELTLDTGIDLTGADVTQIRYMKADRKSTGSFNASPSGSELTYKLKPDQMGRWTFQTYVEIGDDEYLGDEVDIVFKAPIKV